MLAELRRCGALGWLGKCHQRHIDDDNGGMTEEEQKKQVMINTGIAVVGLLAAAGFWYYMKDVEKYPEERRN